MWHFGEGLRAPPWLLWGSCRLGDGRMRFPRGVLQLSRYSLSVLCLCCALFTLLHKSQDKQSTSQP